MSYNLKFLYTVIFAIGRIYMNSAVGRHNGALLLPEVLCPIHPPQKQVRVSDISCCAIDHRQEVIANMKVLHKFANYA